ncbi:hypothetical protein DESUT3_18590 [Desulfuromonas versatilis]|uniref:Zinc finger CHC2-type domain-containing protein n=1 Tax=Desulfuromonas versatilis TaxID=2802975 RepID=A0ABM8HUQ7_9BACT|nr:hypothetical protein [Desulfuromonas versatilis]BCR04790.1 hypothetical protein DESUT3_18590 [Desulfuromonas versatilis]
MTEDRRSWDLQVERSHAVEKVAADLGLLGAGRHFFCPGCQPDGTGTPELVIKGGDFQCFRCGAQGDVVGLVKLAKNCDLDAAIAWLARETEDPQGTGPGM